MKNITTDTVLQMAFKTASELLDKLVDCETRSPVATCGMTDRTCAPFVQTQSVHIQGAAVKTVADIMHWDQNKLTEALSVWKDRVCPPEYTGKLCTQDFAEGTENIKLVDEIATEAVYTLQYLARVSSNAVVYRGLALSFDHPLVQKLALAGKLYQGGKYAYAQVGKEYLPRPLESWSMDFENARSFALSKAGRDSLVPIVLQKRLNLFVDHENIDTMHEMTVIPVLTSLLNQKCIGSEKEVLLLWDGPDPRPKDSGGRPLESGGTELTVLEVAR